MFAVISHNNLLIPYHNIKQPKTGLGPRKDKTRTGRQDEEEEFNYIITHTRIHERHTYIRTYINKLQFVILYVLKVIMLSNTLTHVHTRRHRTTCVFWS